jgi:putative restriction endonuclease
MRTPDELLKTFAELRVNKTGNRRAPHKPLLILHVLSRWQTEGKTEFLYDDIAPALEPLLKEYGPPHVKNPQPSNPFWYLQSDGIWHLTDPKDPNALKYMNRPNVSLFRNHGVFGSLSDDVWHHIQNTQGFFTQIVRTILSNHFESTLHQDIIDAFNLNVLLEGDITGALLHPSIKANRDPQFRINVLRAYNYSCAVCDFKAWLDNTPVGIEAAHVQWFTHKGPDSVTNGVAMCSLHHKLFDRGVFTIDESHKIIISDAAHGSSMYLHLMEHFHEQELREPKHSYDTVAERYREWHVKEVFRGYG